MPNATHHMGDGTFYFIILGFGITYKLRHVLLGRT
jgi:hypothetical protein